MSKNYSELKEKFKDEQQELPLLSFPIIDEIAFNGILKTVVDTASINSEASRIAIAVTFIQYFCTCVGRRVHLPIGDYQLHCRPYSLLIGKSSKARKGTSSYFVARLFDYIFTRYPFKGQIHQGGLSSGEGLINAIRDPSDDGKDLGVPNKQILVLESEFANVLINCKRDTSILSGIIRNAFDGVMLAPLTKHNRIKASNPHVVLLGHITTDELKNKLKGTTESRNGMLNRFLFFMTRRDRLIPRPKPTSFDKLKEIAESVIDILSFVDELPEHYEMQLTDDAEVFWEATYIMVSQEIPGLMGDLLSRIDMYLLMYAMIFALLSKSCTIDKCHFEQAIAWINYAQESTHYIFSNSIEMAKQNRTVNLANQIVTKLKETSLSRTEINHLFNRHRTSDEIKEAILFLLDQSPPQIRVEKIDTAGRSKEIYSYIQPYFAP